MRAGAMPAILSGPSFAADVARGLPTAVTLAARDEKLAVSAGATRSARATFRLYQSTDVRGVEIGGAAKNVLAIAAGIVAGRGLGASAAAALTTRGFAELLRFGKRLGARPETLIGLSGLGDLILTCSSPQSRNFSLRRALGKGRRREAIARHDRAGGRRLHRRGAGRDGAGEGRRHADRRRGRGRARRTPERRRGDRVAADAAVRREGWE